MDRLRSQMFFTKILCDCIFLFLSISPEHQDDAFGSIRHSLIHVALEHYGLDQELRTVIKSLYTDLSVSLELNGETIQIKQEKGVFQGDCLSSTL
jgi:hypothetical protein